MDHLICLEVLLLSMVFQTSIAELFVSPAGPYFKGETITLTCIIQPSSGTFTSTEAAFQFNNSATCYVGSNINGDMTGDINSTRYTYTGFLQGSSLTNATGVLVIDPFMVIDATFPFACCGAIGGGLHETFNNTFLLLAAPPSAANISIYTTYDSPTSCTGTITLTWLAVASDRAVTSYEVLLNGTNISTIPPMAMNSYTTVSLDLLGYYATYTMMATSCAGSSTSSPVSPLTPAPPPTANVSISATYDSPTSCNGTITLTWLAVTSDRTVTSYEVLLDGTNITTLSPTEGNNTYTTASMSLATFNARYTVRAVNCAGSSVSNEVVYTPPTAATLPNITYITGNSSYIVFSIASTGIIAEYYIHINGSTDMITPTTSGNVYIYIGSLIPMYGDYSFSISAGNCIGNSSNSNSLFIIGDVKPSTTTPYLSTTSIISTLTASSSTATLYIPPSACTCTNCTTSDMFITNTPQSSLTTPTTSSTSEQSSSSISYLAVIVILAILLLVAIIINIILTIYIIYLSRKNKNKNNVGNAPANNPTDTVHMYNYIDLNDLPQAPNTQHYYSEMHTIATTSIGNTIPEYVNNDDERPTYANLA